MRFRHCLLACLIVTSSSSAFARGGPGGAFGAVIEELLVIAIVGGLIAGTACALFLHRTPWKTLAFLSVVAVIAAFKFPLAGIFLSIPAIALVAVFASIYYLVRGGLFRARLDTPSSTTTNGPPQETEAASTPSVLRWIAGTYVFWAAVSLANFELLSFLAIPPLVFLPITIWKFLPFILPPLVAALAVGVIVTAVVLEKSLANQHVAPFIFNACVLLTFFISAEIYRNHLVSQSLLDHNPRHIESSSFLHSVLTYRIYFREPHASFDENGKTYRWSYSERKFFQVP